MLYGIKDFKKAFMIFLAYKLILVQNITIISIPGIPLLTIEMLMNLYFSVLYVLKKGKNQAKISYPFLSPALLLLFSWTLSTIFSVAGFTSEMSMLLGNAVNDVFLIYMVWNTVETKKDFDFLFVLITIVVLGSCVYGFIEYGLQYNPLAIYESTLNHDPSKNYVYDYGTLGARGYRAKSIFDHAIGAGMIWSLYCAFVFMAIISYNEKLKAQGLAILTAVLCIPMLILTKQRSGILFLAILAITFVKPNKKKMYYIMIPCLVGVLFFGEDILNNVLTLVNVFNSNYKDTVGGSSASMRFEQFGAAFELLLRSPICGLGSKYRTVLNDATIRLLRGVESIWLFVVPCYGLVGLSAYLVSAYWEIYRIPKYFKAKNLRWLMLAYWTVNSLTSIPGFKVHLIYLVAIYIIKKSSKYQTIEKSDIKEWSMRNGKIIHRKIY